MAAAIAPTKSAILCSVARLILPSTSSECTAFYDADFANYFDAQQLEVFIGDGVANGALALDENGDWYVPLSEVDELAYGDYTASGGTLSRADWEIAGHPENLIVEQLDNFNVNEHRRLLRDRIGGQPYDGLFAHHVIPMQALTAYPELMRRGAIGGFDINEIYNGILLTREDHVGGHPGYNADMMEALAEVNVNGTPAEIAAELHAIAALYLTAIRNNTYGPWY